jgi:hypothetical protein
MFRIGGEEDLLDLPTAGALDAPAPESHVRRTERTEPISARAPRDSTPPPPGLDTRDPAVPLAPSLRPPGREAELAASRIAEDGVRNPPSRRRRREPRAHQRSSVGRQDRSTAAPARRHRAGPIGWQSWIASINAAILAVLIVAAVIGHDPPSTTVAAREPHATPKQAVAQPVASALAPADAPVDAPTARANITPKPRVHRPDVLPSHRARRRAADEAHMASEPPSDRSPASPTPQEGSVSPPAAAGHRVASSAPPDPASRSTPRTPIQRRREAENSQNAASVEFGP